MSRSFIFSICLIWASFSIAGDSICSQVHRDFKPTEQVERNLIETGTFDRDRSFYEYLLAFGPEFHRAIESLSTEGVWVDMGAGHGLALRDFSQFQFEKNKPLPKLVGISKDGAGFDSTQHAIVWLGGRFYEEIPSELLPARYDIVTDYYGILSYTSKVSEYLDSVFEKLPVGGRFFAVLHDGDRLQRGESLYHRFIGSESLVSYLQTTPNLEVKRLKAGRGVPLGSTILMLTKKGPVQFAPLVIQKYTPGTPPKRVFIRTGP